MSDIKDEQSEGTWPGPKFNFSVKIGTDEIMFQEVSGLDTETQIIDYMAGNSHAFSTIKMPGIKKYGNVTLKKGVFQESKTFWSFYQAAKMNTIKRTTVIISLLDENKNVAMSWTLSNAWPTKFTASDLKADGNDVAVESIELAHEGLVVNQ